MSDDYSKSAPPKSQAPFVEVPLMHYLEQVVLAEDRPVVHRITAGKLRLCAQASLRHSDLTSTPLRYTEWCFYKGTKKVVGIRARAPVTKTGARPWVASLLGVTPKGDGWLSTLVDLLIASHGSDWQTQDFLGCSPHGLSAFLPYPSTLSADTDILKRMMINDLDAGVPVPLSKEAVRGFQVAWGQTCDGDVDDSFPN